MIDAALRSVVTVGLVLSIAPLMVWVERRLLAGFQDRYGPNRVGPFGILQTAADAIKLLTKEDWVPPFADRGLFVLAPAIIAVSVLLSFAVVPMAGWGALLSLDVGLLYFLALSSMGVYSVVLAGISSNSKYSLLGAVRAAAQMISYELALGLSLAAVVVMAGTFDLERIVALQRDGPWFAAVQPLAFLLFVIAGMAEAKRLPFDLPEAENELVAGFHTEYSSMKFALFFLGEYMAILLFAAIGTTVFLGGDAGPWLPGWLWFAVKIFGFFYLFVWIRATFPRVRYDQLMGLGWKVLLPLALANLMVTGAVVASGVAGAG